MNEMNDPSETALELLFKIGVYFTADSQNLFLHVPCHKTPCKVPRQNSYFDEECVAFLCSLVELICPRAVVPKEVEYALDELRQEFLQDEESDPHHAAMSPAVRCNPVIPLMIRYAGRIGAGEIDVVDCVYFFDAMTCEASFTEERNWPGDSVQFIASLEHAIPLLKELGIVCRLSPPVGQNARRTISTYWIADFQCHPWTEQEYDLLSDGNDDAKFRIRELVETVVSTQPFIEPASTVEHS
jgi:hypothetical protein